MIIRTVCNTCLSSFQLLVEASDVELVKQIADDKGQTCPCPRLCGGRIFLTHDPVGRALANDPRLRPALPISGKELFQAVNGLGLPDEVPVGVEIIEAMLKSSKVSSVSVQLMRGHVYLHELHLENGITLHLTAGPHGAEVLKMTKERTDGTAHSV